MPRGKDPNPVFTQARRGFSLVELVIVIVILGLFGAIAVPRFANAGVSYRADAAARLIADALRSAAVDARIRSETALVNLSVSHDRFNAGIPLSSITLAEIALSAPPHGADITAVRTDDGLPSIEINALGLFSQSAVITLEVGDQTRAVILDATSGTVSVGTQAEGNSFTTARGLQ